MHSSYLWLDVTVLPLLSLTVIVTVVAPVEHGRLVSSTFEAFLPLSVLRGLPSTLDRDLAQLQAVRDVDVDFDVAAAGRRLDRFRRLDTTARGGADRRVVVVDRATGAVVGGGDGGDFGDVGDVGVEAVVVAVEVAAAVAVEAATVAVAVPITVAIAVAVPFATVAGVAVAGDAVVAVLGDRRRCRSGPRPRRRERRRWWRSAGPRSGRRRRDGDCRPVRVLRTWRATSRLS